MKIEETPPPLDEQDEVAALIRTLHATEQRLEELTGGEVDTVSSGSGKPFLLRRAQEQLRRNDAARQDAILNALPAHIAMLDAAGMIIAVNEAWRHFGRANAGVPPGHGVGVNYLDICDQARGQFSAEAHAVATGIRTVLAGTAKTFSIEYPCHSPVEQRWFLLMVTPLAYGHRPGAVVMHLNITQRRQAAEELRESEERFAGAFEHAPIGMALVDTTGRWLKVNRALCDLLGYSEAELLRSTFQDITHPEDLALDLENVGRLLAGDIRSYEMEKRYIQAHGEVVTVLLNVSLVRDDQRRPAYFISHIQDITARKQTGALLERNRQRLALATESAHIGIWEWDVVTNKLIWDEQMYVLYGIGESDFSGAYDAWQNGVHPDDRRRSTAEISAAVDGAAGFHTEFRVVWPGGEVRVIEAHAVMHNSADGTSRRMVGVNWDITARKRSEEALLQRQTELQALFDLIPAMIWLKDTENRILRVNRRVAEAAGKTVVEIEGQPSQDIYPQDAARFFADDLAVMKTRAPKLDYVEAVANPAGKKLWVQTDKVPMLDSEGKVTGIIVMAQDITERREAMEVLRESEARFRFLNNLTEATRLLASPDQIMDVMSRLLGEHLRASRCAYADVEKDGERFTILHDYTDGCVSTVGNYQLSLFGPRAVATLRSGQTLVLRHVAEELLPGEGADMFKAIGIQAIITCPLIKDGRLRALMAVHQTTPRDWQPGEIAIVLEVVERCWATIERRTAEEQLRMSESLRRIAGRTSRLGGWAVDLPEGRITWSDEICAIHEVPAGTVPGMEQAFGFITPSSRTVLSEAFAACVRSGTPYDIELELTTAKGRRIWVRIIGEAQRNAAGEITGAQGALQDITESREIMGALRESNEKFNQLADHITDAFWIRSPDMKSVHYVSPAFEKIWGRSVASLLANPHEWINFILAEDRERVRTAFTALTDGTSSLELEYRIVRPTGEIRWVRVRGFQVRDATNQLIRHIGIVTDITESKELNEHLLQAQKMEALGQFSGGVAHDFNNILAAIGGYTELAQMNLQGNPVVRDHLGSVIKATNRAADLVRQILTFSRQQAQTREVLLLQPVVVESMKLMRATIPSTVGIEAVIEADAPTVLANANQVHQVLMNLAVNGWHALINQPGRLLVKLEKMTVDAAFAAMKPGLRPGIYARLSVTDTGCGMDALTLLRIFEPFFTTKPPGKGTGLGLAVVHGIMSSHDGAVTVDSQPGEGTTFRLYFPEHVGEAAARSVEARSTPRGQGERVLLVDDEDMLTQVGTKLLTQLGYAVESTTNSGHALALVRADPGRFALVLTDQTMPGMTGLQLAGQLQDIQPGLLILLMTGYNLSLTPDRVEASCVGNILQKPFTFHELGTAVQATLHGKRYHPHD